EIKIKPATIQTRRQATSQDTKVIFLKRNPLQSKQTPLMSPGFLKTHNPKITYTTQTSSSTSQAYPSTKAVGPNHTNKKSTPAACKQPTNSSASSKPCQINPRHSLTQAPLASTPPHKMKYIAKHHPPPRTTLSDGPYPPGNKKPNKQSNSASAPALCALASFSAPMKAHFHSWPFPTNYSPVAL